MPDILPLFAESVPLQEAIGAQSGFAEGLVAECPELLGSPSPVGDPDPGGTQHDDEGIDSGEKKS
jgi:hypothetical protein